MHILVKRAQTFDMKLKILTTILLTATVLSTLCACNQGQTGGGQNLNDGPEKRTVQEQENEEEPDAGFECPDGECPVKPRFGDEWRTPGETPPPPPRFKRGEQRRIFGNNQDN